MVVAAATITPVVEQSTLERLCIVCGEFGVIDAIQNLVLFLPLGAGLAIAGVRPRLAFPVLVAATVSIELLQLTVIGGRDASLGDIIWNSLGGATGWALGARAETLLRPGRRSSLVLTVFSLSLWLATCLVVPLALRPDPTGSLYVGQLAHALGGRPAYAGRVLATTVGHVTVPDHDIPHTRALRQALLSSDGANIEVELVPAPALQEASIARIVDQERREIFELSTRATDLLFDFRTYASRLRLRPIQFRLQHAFDNRPVAAPPDTMSVVARYASDRVHLRATSGTGTVAAEIPLTTSSGWRVASPFPNANDGSIRERLLNAGFLFALLVPVGYWLSYGALLHGRRTMLLFAAVTIAAGLAAGPYLFHIAAPTAADFGGIVSGLTAGFVLAAFVTRRFATRASSEV
jgi:VanZ like family